MLPKKVRKDIQFNVRNIPENVQYFAWLSPLLKWDN